MLVSSIIKSGMRKLGLLARGETPTANEYADGLEALQVMLRNWSTEKINVFSETTDSLTLVGGTSTYSWGTAGSLTTTIPNMLDRAFVRDSENYDHPVEVISPAEYDEIQNKGLSDRPNKVAFSASRPTAYVYTYPTPNATETLKLVSVKSFTETSSFSSTSDTLAMPVTYELPIIYNFAMHYASEFGVSIPPEVAMIADESFRKIKSMNASNYAKGVKLDFPAGSVGSYDINLG